jgi:hypothetical protein
MAKNITKVPDGPLIKKTGKFKGSTLKTGGTIKKAQMGSSMFKDNPIYKKTTDLRGKIGSAALGMPGMKPVVKNGSKIKKAQQGIVTPNVRAAAMAKRQENIRKRDSILDRNAAARGMTREQVQSLQSKQKNMSDQGPSAGDNSSSSGAKSPCKGGFCTGLNKGKNGSMLKRADGSTSKRGLWDNIRKNKGSGKKPTKQMLVQEKKIKDKSKK